MSNVKKETEKALEEIREMTNMVLRDLPTTTKKGRQQYERIKRRVDKKKVDQTQVNKWLRFKEGIKVFLFTDIDLDDLFEDRKRKSTR